MPKIGELGSRFREPKEGPVQKNQSTRSVAIIAMVENGATFRIERRSRSLPGEKVGPTYFYSCLPNGEVVTWLGAGHYQLSDGTVVRAHLSRLLPE